MNKFTAVICLITVERCIYVCSIFYVLPFIRSIYTRILVFSYLTGNPCTDYDGYREFVIGTLPQIDVLDGLEVTHHDKLVAKQLLSNVKRKIIAQQIVYES